MQARSNRSKKSYLEKLSIRQADIGGEYPLVVKDISQEVIIFDGIVQRYLIQTGFPDVNLNLLVQENVYFVHPRIKLSSIKKTDEIIRHKYMERKTTEFPNDPTEAELQDTYDGVLKVLSIEPEHGNVQRILCLYDHVN